MKTKQGISLIVLVITIIVMVILAAVVVITLSNTGIINRANEATNKTNKKIIQQIAELTWMEAYTSGKTSESELKTAVVDALKKNNLNPDDYIVTILPNGVKIEDKTKYIATPWTAEKTVTDGKVTAMVVKDSKQTIDVGTVINYMPDGINGHVREWRIFGADDQGRLIILGMANENEYISVVGKEGFNKINAKSVNVNEYIDGKIGVDVKALEVEDVDEITGFNKNNYSYGTAYDDDQLNIKYNTPVTYSWDGDECISYTVNGVTNGVSKYMGSSHENGFDYYNATTGAWQLIPYTTTKKNIATVNTTFYSYSMSDYVDTTIPLYKMLTEKQLLIFESTYVHTSKSQVQYGVRIMGLGLLGGLPLYSSWQENYGGAMCLGILVTLADDCIITYDETTKTATIL